MDTPTVQSAPPAVSIIIPTLDGYRDGKVPRLLDSIARQSFRDTECLLIKGVSPQGRAINEGAAKARGEVLVIVDDDSELADEHVLARLVAALRDDPSIGMAGASIVVAPDASSFQRRAARQFPRFNTPVVDRVTDSDFACHGCCALPKATYSAVGGEREDVLRGLDPDLRARLRRAGHRVVLVPGARVYHPLPSGWRALVKMFFRNGFGSAYTRKFHPDVIYETVETLRGQQTRRTGFPYRVVRFAGRLLRALAEGKLQRFVGYSAYAGGYVWGMLRAEDQHGGGETQPQTRH